MEKSVAIATLPAPPVSIVPPGAATLCSAAATVCRYTRRPALDCFLMDFFVPMAPSGHAGQGPPEQGAGTKAKPSRRFLVTGL
jgi:hypothetical protein